MGRELRRVPEGWTHPRNESGHYLPMYDESFQEAWNDWLAQYQSWLRGEAEYQKDTDERTAEAFIAYHGSCPDPEYFRPGWTDEIRTHLQVYETVSEGTPISPVLATQDAVVEWWVTVGDNFNGKLTQEQAKRWVDNEGSVSMVFDPGVGLIPGAQYP